MQKIYFIALFLTFYFISAYCTNIQGPAPQAGQTSGQKGAYMGQPKITKDELSVPYASPKSFNKLPKKRVMSSYNQRKNISNRIRNSNNQRRDLPSRRRTLSNRRGTLPSRRKTLSNRRRTLSSSRRTLSNKRRNLSNRRRTLSNRRRTLPSRRRNYKRRSSNNQRRNMRRNSNRNSRNSERVVKKKVFTLIKVAKEYKEILSEISSDKKILKKKLEDIIDKYMDF